MTSIIAAILSTQLKVIVTAPTEHPHLMVRYDVPAIPHMIHCSTVDDIRVVRAFREPRVQCVQLTAGMHR